MTNFLKKPVVIISLIVLVGAGIGGYAYFGGDNAPTYDFVVAQKQNLIQEVSVTGRVKPAKSVDLAFEKAGRMKGVFVKIGDRVSEGDILVSLSQSDLLAQLAEVQAKVESARAQFLQHQVAREREEITLSELQRGTRPEEIQITSTKAANAQNALDDANRNLSDITKKASVDLDNVYDDVKDILNDAYTQGDDAVNKQLGELFSNASLENPRLTFFTTDVQKSINAESERLQMTQLLKAFKAEVDTLSGEYSTLDDAMNKTEMRLQDIRDFFSTVNDAVNAAFGLAVATTNTYRANITTSRNNLNSALSSISSQKQLIAAQKITNQNNITAAKTKVNDAKSALLVAKDELALKEAGTAKEQIQAQEAVLRQAELTVASQEAVVKQMLANTQNIQTQIEKTILTSPITGIVIKQDAKVGEIVAANATLVSLISEAKFEIEANVPEADIAKVSVGNTSLVTLDAYGRDVVFEAKVVAVDPAETIVDGVATYKATFQFAKNDERVKSGMTANIDVKSANRENVIAVPQRAIIRKNGDQFVRILNGEDFEEVKVETGLRGSDGNIEIISGVSEGDKVITFSEE
ncbi:efflux RND transporter periplasmic adaptor subunit [Candidatus Falkowbacteria bacterium]|nr:efflux RND transporter periplasmic adaptor subunit [Candidatus Falkowbacteria bacterium]